MSENFEFDVGGVLSETCFFSADGVAEIVLNGFHLFEGESESAFAADFHEAFIGNFEVVFTDAAGGYAFDEGEVHGDVVDFCTGEDSNGLDEFVAEEFDADGFCVIFGKGFAVEEVFDGTENMFIFAEFSAEDVGNSGFGGAADIVGNTGFEADNYDEIGSCGGFVIGGSGISGAP